MTLISRVFGYLRDAVIFILFGASGYTDAFFVAFRIPNFLRRLFAEGAFSQAFVPVLSEYKEQRGKAELKGLVDHAAGALALVLGLVTALGMIAAPLIITVFAPGFWADDAVRFELATDMLRITFPYLFFISLTALAAGILNSFGRFAVPALTPVFLNLSLIGAAIWLAPRFEIPVIALAWGVFIAGVVQFAFQIPFLKRLGLLPRPRLQRAHEGVRRIGRLMLPAIFGSSVVQINLLVDTLIASFLAVGSISWLYVSDRFVEFPLALFGIAVATVILPRLSRQHAQSAPEAFNRTLDWALRTMVVMSIPTMFGLMLLAGPILTTLIQYREFTFNDTQMARLSMIAFAFGLPAFIMIKVLAPGFYARQDTKTPMRIGVIAMLVNMVLNVALVVPWVYSGWPGPHAALALATSLCAYLNAGLLYRRLRGDGVLHPQAGWRKLLMQVSLATAIMFAVVIAYTPALSQWSSWLVTQRGLALASLILVGAAVYFFVLLASGVRPKQFALK
ncbi:MAG: murein biosynthesis integral membrane protein MurJ [Gammaproteobacteria bacterium]